jgi:hypothetical protein
MLQKASWSFLQEITQGQNGIDRNFTMWIDKGFSEKKASPARVVPARILYNAV